MDGFFKFVVKTHNSVVLILSNTLKDALQSYKIIVEADMSNKLKLLKIKK
jgi:hypothetical protein